MDDTSLPDILIRYGPPNKLDKAPYLTKCKVIQTIPTQSEFYIQMSKDADDPKWELLEPL